MPTPDIRVTLSREVVLSQNMVRLLRVLTKGHQWNHTGTFDRLIDQGLAREDSDGDTQITKDGISTLEIIDKA